MGNFEKLVVLTVLFLSAIVLAVSLSGDDEVEAAGPMDAARMVLEEESGTPGPAGPRIADPSKAGTAGTAREPAPVEPLAGGATDGGTGTRARALLDSAVRPGQATEPERGGIVPAAEAERPAPARADGRVRILKDTRGLESAGIDDFMVHVVDDGDTWLDLARRFYGDTRYVSHLRANNEEVEDLVSGESILVPLYDYSVGAGERAPHRPQPPRSGAALAAATEYVVRDGDNLSSISKAVYGTPNRWDEIYRANRDVLDDPDWLDVGTTLKIPR